MPPIRSNSDCGRKNTVSPQFSLAALLLLVTMTGLLVAAVVRFGLATVIFCLVVICGPPLLLLAWGWALWRAPVLVKHATVLLLFITIGAALLPSWLVRARDEARRNQSIDQLRRLGHELHAQQQLHPRRSPSQMPADRRAFMQQESVRAAGSSPSLAE